MVLAAKFYRPRVSVRAPASPVKRMLADLQLLGERTGVLLFAFQRGLGATLDAVDKEEEEEPALLADDAAGGAAGAAQFRYRLAPAADSAQAIPPDTRIAVWQVAPLPGAAEGPAVLSAILDEVHAALRTRTPIACRGVFLDSLSATAHGTLADAAQLVERNGQPVTVPLDQLLLCPKPHVAPWRVDLVSLAHDCCNVNSALCHIARRAGVKPPARLAALDAVTTAIRDAAPGQDPDLAAQVAQQHVLAITRRYAELLKPDPKFYAEWVRAQLGLSADEYARTPLLGPEQRETLGLARFLAEQVERIGAHNFAGPTLLFTGVLEYALQKSFFKKLDTLYTTEGPRVPLMKTMGTISNCKEHGGGNWEIIRVRLDGVHWRAGAGSGVQCSLSDWIDMLKLIQPVRNRAAHKAHVTPVEYGDLLLALFGNARTGLGVLNGLLLAWHP